LYLLEVVSCKLRTTGKNQDLVTSLRKLAAASETEYSIIQRISSLKKDPQFTTVAAIIDGLGMNLSDFAEVYMSISEKEIEEYKRNMKKQKLIKVSKGRKQTKK
jgi:hypothetical protein